MARADSVAVPQFEAAERRSAVLKADLVDEHLRCRDRPRKISGAQITHLADPVARTPPERMPGDPELCTSVGAFVVRVTYTMS